MLFYCTLLHIFVFLLRKDAREMDGGKKFKVVRAIFQQYLVVKDQKTNSIESGFAYTKTKLFLEAVLDLLWGIASFTTTKELFAAIFGLFSPRRSASRRLVGLVTPRLELKTDKELCFPRMPDSDSLQLSAAITQSCQSEMQKKDKGKWVARNEMLTEMGRK